jgi:2-polyprenyl-6-methoxyphenol hydroxylase-like FAD-dependent oxidoreductase
MALARRLRRAWLGSPDLLAAIAAGPTSISTRSDRTTLDSCGKGARYCGATPDPASPTSGQGTSMDLAGAYVLAGERAGGEHETAFGRYETELRPFVDLNQKLGSDVARKMVPSRTFQAGLRNLTMRMMPYLPGKAGVIEQIMKPIREAANGILLKGYRG